jgi:hypothetical protein
MEQKQIFKELDFTLDELIQGFSSFDESEFNIVPFDGSWTAGELSQHLVKSIGGFVELINGPVKVIDRAEDALCSRIKSDFLNFSVKFKSPSFIVPEQQEYDKEIQIKTLQELKARILQAENLDLTMQCSLFEIPPYGAFSRLEALTLVLYHTQRHLRQLKNIYQKVEENKKLV